MKRVVDIDRVYVGSAQDAVRKFFRRFPQFSYWKEEFEYMADNCVEHTCDNVMADGSYNPNWSYSLWLEECNNLTYIALVMRA